PELALGHHLLEGVARHIQGQVDPAPPAGRLPGCKDQLRRPQSVAAAKRRILPFLEGPYKVGDRPVDITRAVAVFAAAVDGLPVLVAAPPDAEHRHALAGGADLDDPLFAHQAMVAPDKACARARGRQAKDAVVVLPEGKGLVFVVPAKDQVFLAVINLRDHPEGRPFVVEVVAEVKVVGAVIVEVAKAKGDLAQPPDLPRVQEGLRLAERRAVAALVVKGELGAAGLAHFDHALGALPRIGHGLFAVDALDARLSRRDHHLLMQVGPRADADDVKLLFLQHLPVVRVDLGDAKKLRKSLAVFARDVRAGDDRALRQLLIRRGVLVSHAVTEGAGARRALAGPDETDT